MAMYNSYLNRICPYGDRMKLYWAYGDRIKPVELTRGVDFMCGCTYDLVRLHTVFHGLVRSLLRLYTDMAPVSGF